MPIEIKVYDAGVLVAELGAVAESCRFDLGAYGCGACEIELREKWRQDRGVRRGQDLRIHDASGNLLWRGIIRRTIKCLGGDRLQIDAAGHAWLLRELALSSADEASYSSQAPELVAQNLFDTIIAPQSAIGLFEFDPSGVVLESFSVREGEDCWMLLDRLAALAGGLMWGVDEQLKLYFVNPNNFASAPLHTFELGGDVLELALADADLVINDLRVAGTGYAGRFEDAASIAEFGRKYYSIAAPQIDGAADAQLLADGVFACWARPAPLRVIRAAAPELPLRPWTGRIAVRDSQREAEGFVAHTLGSVRYVLLGTGMQSPVVEVQLGVWDRVDWNDSFAFGAAFARTGLSTLANLENFS